MRGHAHRDGVEAGECEIGHAAIGLLRQHQRQRPGPERSRQPLGSGGKVGHAARCIDIRDVRDQRIE